MSTHRNIERICCAALVLALAAALLFWNGERLGLQRSDRAQGYAARLFDTTRVHTIDIVMDDWEGFLETCENEEYQSCAVVVDNEAYKNVALRAKGNTSLSMVSSYGNNRYSFKIEFDHYDSGNTYYGLDKLCLNNIIQDNTYLKDYLAYTLMREAGVPSPLCSFVYLTVNGEDWGLYLAVEAVEDAFLSRNYGSDSGNLYKPDSTGAGGGRGNGRDFNMDDLLENMGQDALPEGFPGFQRGGAPGEENGPDGGSEGGDTTNQGSGHEPDDGAAGRDNGAAEGGGRDGDTANQGSGHEPDDGAAGRDNGAAEGGGRDGDTASQGGGHELGGGAADRDNGAAESGGRGDDTSQGGGHELDDGASSRDGDESGQSGEDAGAGQARGGNREGFGGGAGMAGGGPGGIGSSDVMLQYVDDDPDSYPNIFDNAKTAVTDADKARLIASLKKLSEQEDLESVVSIDEVIRYFAVHDFLCNDDSYTGSIVHNYYLYEKDGVLSMIPWDYNLSFGTMGGGSDASSAVNSPIDSPVSGTLEDRPMAAWIFSSEEYTAQYHEAYAQLVAALTEGDSLSELIRTTAERIAPYVEKDPTKFCTYEEFQTGVETLLQFCELRLESIAGQLDGSIPSTSDGQRQDSSALIDASAIQLSAMGSMQNGRGGAGGGERGGFGGAPGGGPPAGDAPETGGEPPAGDAPEMGGEPPAGDAPETGGEHSAGDAPEMSGEPPTSDAPETGGEPPAGDAPEMSGEPPTSDAPETGGEHSAGDAPERNGASPEDGAGSDAPTDGGQSAAASENQRQNGGFAGGNRDFAQAQQPDAAPASDTLLLLGISLAVLLAGLAIAIKFKR